jgi:hypothetical protein
MATDDTGFTELSTHDGESAPGGGRGARAGTVYGGSLLNVGEHGVA